MAPISDISPGLIDVQEVYQSSRVPERLFGRIPNRVFQTYKTGMFDREHAERLIHQRMRYPEHNFFFYDDASMDAYMLRYWSHRKIFQIFHSARFGASKADIWRYCVLYHLGGIYVDVDSELGFDPKSISPLANELISFEDNILADIFNGYDWPHASLFAPRAFSNPNLMHPRNICLQWALIFAPFHPLLYRVIEGIENAYDFFRDRSFENVLFAVVNFTGPVIFTRAVWEFTDAGGTLLQCDVDYSRTSKFKVLPTKLSESVFFKQPNYFAVQRNSCVCETSIPRWDERVTSRSLRFGRRSTDAAAEFGRLSGPLATDVFFFEVSSLLFDDLSVEVDALCRRLVDRSPREITLFCYVKPNDIDFMAVFERLSVIVSALGYIPAYASPVFGAVDSKQSTDGPITFTRRFVRSSFPQGSIDRAARATRESVKSVPKRAGSLTAPEIRDLVGTDAPLILEIGAHDGSSTAEFLRAMPNARIFCFEPDPRAIRRHRARLGADSRVTLMPCAIGRAVGSVRFWQSGGFEHLHPDGWDHSGSIKKPKGHLGVWPGIRFDNQIEVPLTTLDVFHSAIGMPTVDFIWADVQGAEEDLIVGGQKILRSTRFLYTEYSNEELYEGEINLQGIYDLLVDFTLLSVFEGDVLFKNGRI